MGEPEFLETPPGIGSSKLEGSVHQTQTYTTSGYRMCSLFAEAEVGGELLTRSWMVRDFNFIARVLTIKVDVDQEI